MQRRCATRTQLLAKTCHHIQPEGLDGRGVVAITLQAQANPAWNLAPQASEKRSNCVNW
jgi:hypothetical protein